MSNAYKIIKNFFSDRFSPGLKEKVWNWLVEPVGEVGKEEALMRLWEEVEFKADETTIGSYQSFRKRCGSHRKSSFIISYVGLCR